MDLRRFYCAVISITASPNTPHKAPAIHSERCTGTMWGLVPKTVWMLDPACYENGNQGITHWKDFVFSLPGLLNPSFAAPQGNFTCFSQHWQGFSSIHPAKSDILKGRTGIPHRRSSFAEKGMSIIHQITPNIIFIHCPYRFLFKAPAVSAFSLGDSTKGSFLFIQELFLSNKATQH